MDEVYIFFVEDLLELPRKIIEKLPRELSTIQLYSHL
jgi:hypothetical protein